jgi:hypothetical protein
LENRQRIRQRRYATIIVGVIVSKLRFGRAAVQNVPAWRSYGIFVSEVMVMPSFDWLGAEWIS